MRELRVAEEFADGSVVAEDCTAHVQALREALPRC
jgi:hypothetical protein